MMITDCDQCNEEYKTPRSHYIRKNNHFCSQECYSKYQKKNPSNTGKTWIKKGHTPWNKNEFLVDKPKQRRMVYYRRLIFESSDKPFCNRCSEEAKLVHHINHDKHDNRLENLEPLCYSCHSIEHNTVQNLPTDGGWNKRRGGG